MRTSIKNLPGVAPLGSVDLLDRYIRERGAGEIGSMAAEVVGPSAAVFAVEEVAAHLQRMRADREVNGGGVVGFLKEAHHLAKLAAITTGNEARQYSTLGTANGLRTTSFTNFLGRALGISQRTIDRASGQDMRILAHYWDGAFTGDITLNFESIKRRRGGYPIIEPLAVVALNDGAEFINVSGYTPFRGEGNMANVPGAAEALMEDAMIKDYSTPPQPQE